MKVLRQGQGRRDDVTHPQYLPSRDCAVGWCGRRRWSGADDDRGRTRAARRDSCAAAVRLGGRSGTWARRETRPPCTALRPARARSSSGPRATTQTAARWPPLRRRRGAQDVERAASLQRSQTNTTSSSAANRTSSVKQCAQ